MAQFTSQGSFELALQHHRAGRLHEAEEIYQQILAQQPDHAGALHYLGVLTHQQGQNDIAIDLIRKAITLSPNLPEAHNNLGLALTANGRLGDAIAAYRTALALRPDYASALFNLGIALQYNGQLDDAIDSYKKSVALRPNYVEALTNLGNALRDKGKLEEAGEVCRQAIALRPDYAKARSALGNVLNEMGRFDDAIAAHREAIEIDPRLPETHNNLGIALKNQRRTDQAIAAFEQAIALDPDYASAHTNLSMALLARGEYLRGWKEHEWRWKCEDTPSKPRGFSQPQWDGSPLEDRTLLLHAEQGFGDSMQFIRYASLLADRGQKIIIECQSELVRLFKSLSGGFRIVEQGQPLPDFDVHCPLLNLPSVFKTTIESIPADVPYLFPDQELLESWRQKLADRSTGLKIALIWAGNPDFKGDRTRSLTLDRLAPLADVPGVTFYSIQKGNAQWQINRAPAGLRLMNLSPELHDFADTAAVIGNMDLTISTDTSVAHLAGALGRPVWVMLQFVPDWRWMFDDPGSSQKTPQRCPQKSPWYPSMRLFRQAMWGDWNGVIERVAQALRARVSGIS